MLEYSRGAIYRGRYTASRTPLLSSEEFLLAQGPGPSSSSISGSYSVILSHLCYSSLSILLSSILHFKQRDTEIDSGVFLQSGCIFFSTLPSEYAAGKGYIFSLLLCTASLALHCPFGCAVLCPLGHCTVHCTAALTCFGPISPNMFRPYQP